MTELTVIIPSYNTKLVLLDCIRSVISSESGLKLEIIVVDNGSSDGSSEAAESLLKNTKSVKGVVIKNKVNLGFAKAVNQGIRRGTSEYFLLLNSDIVVKKGSIEKMFKFSKSAEGVGVVGGRLYDPQGSIQKSCMNFPTLTNAIKEYFFGIKDAFSKFTPVGDKPGVVDVVVGAAFLITPTAIQKVGLLNERFFMFFEDIEYCRRVKKNGLKVYYLPEGGFVHYHGLSGKKIADEGNQWRRLIPSSKIYHGVLEHYILTAILWLGQKYQKVLGAK